MTAPITLQSLLKHVAELFSASSQEAMTYRQDEPVTGITTDSRKVGPGTIFVAWPGSATDGHRFIPQALAAGAFAIVVQADRVSDFQDVIGSQALLLAAEDCQQAYAALVSAFHGEPGKHLRMVGVTGTNGKTTVTHLIERILTEAGIPCGLIGTLGVRLGQSESSESGYQTTGHTTPMAGELQETLATMRTAGSQAVVMEVSSHALDQSRVYGCDFEVAVFTNLTQDHLDYHKTMERYAEAKARLFKGLNPKTGPKYAVINLDDKYAHVMLAAVPAGVSLMTFALQAPDAMIRLEEVQYSITGSSFTVVTPQGRASVRLRLGGQFSVYNALAALSAGLALGIPLETCVRALEAVPGVRGRFEVVAESPFVIVDYAHTPDGLENVLKAARLVVPEGGELIAVFGCGGDRDATKRPKMGHIAEVLADKLVVTSDNPRTEDPQQIISDILTGIQRFDHQKMMVNPDREQAIHLAIDMARPNDVIVVAGKGHEDYQILGDRVIHFDDREVVQHYMAKRQAAAAPSA